MKLSLLKNTFILFFCLSIILFGQTKINTISHGNSKQDNASLKFSAVGDIMCHSTQFKYAHIPPDGYNFDPVFEYVKPFLMNSDFTMGNIETVFAGSKRKYSGYPLFNSPDELMQSLANTGFDLLFTSNNHALDKGEKGLIRTIDLADSLGIGIIGTYKSKEDRDSLRIYEKNNITFGMLSYTYSLNGFSLSVGKDYMISQIDKQKIKDEINSLKSAGADIVIIYFHFGNEYETEPSPYQKEIVKNAVDSGADIIIASHPHVLQPVEIFKPKNSRLDTGFVAYSLGNFVSNQRWRFSDCGIILNFEIAKDFSTDSLKLSDLNYLPFWVFKGKIDGKPQYKIIPSEISEWYYHPEFLSVDDIKLMKSSLEDSKEIIEKNNSMIRQLLIKEFFKTFPLGYKF